MRAARPSRDADGKLRKTTRTQAAAARQLAEQARANTLAAERWRVAENEQRDGDIA